jgi:hypothetical protein
VADIVAREALRLKEFGRKFGPEMRNRRDPRAPAVSHAKPYGTHAPGVKPGAAVLSRSFQRISMKNRAFDRVDESSLPATSDFTGSRF